MSSTDVALIVSGAVDLAIIGCGTVLAWRVLGRVRVVAPPKDAAPGPDAPQPAHPRVRTVPHPLPPQAAQRQAAYDRLRSEDSKTAAEAAEVLGIIARSTARDYENRWAVAQNGAGT